MACDVAQLLDGSGIADDGCRGELLLVVREEGRRRPACVDGAIAATRALCGAVELKEVRERRRIFRVERDLNAGAPGTNRPTYRPAPVAVAACVPVDRLCETRWDVLLR